MGAAARAGAPYSAACAWLRLASPAGLDPASLERILATADQARAAAFASADPGPLRAVFADAAIAGLAPQLARLHRRGERVEERDVSARLVHWAAGAGTADGVLEVAGEQRVLVAGAAHGWSRIVRQWSASLAWSGARWLVVRAGDIPPGQWWIS